MDIIFNRKYIAIGEDHVGKYEFNFNDATHTNNLESFLSGKNSISIWYEGPNITAKSKSYKNFVSDFKNYIRNNDIKCSVSEKGWETDLSFSKDSEYTTVLLGAEPSQVISLIGSKLDGKRTLLDAIVDSGKFKGSRSAGPSKSDVIYALSDGGRPSEILKLMMEDNSATKEVIYRIYGGSSPMRDLYFEGSAGALISSAIYKRVKTFNESRDKHLANKMQTVGGIFLAGNDHINLIKKFLR